MTLVTREQVFKLLRQAKMNANLAEFISYKIMHLIEVERAAKVREIAKLFKDMAKDKK